MEIGIIFGASENLKGSENMNTASENFKRISASELKRI
jgi:hypothetical protein